MVDLRPCRIVVITHLIKIRTLLVTGVVLRPRTRGTLLTTGTVFRGFTLFRTRRTTVSRACANVAAVFHWTTSLNTSTVTVVAHAVRVAIVRIALVITPNLCVTGLVVSVSGFLIPPGMAVVNLPLV
jgi:hypothetical protein